jgi:hypothetical protein
MYVPVSSFNFIGNLAASMTEWQLILKKGGSFQFNKFRASLRSAQFFLSAPPPNLKSWIRP